MKAGLTVERLPIKSVDSRRDGYAPAMVFVPVLSMVTAAALFALVSRLGGFLKMIGGLDRWE